MLLYPKIAEQLEKEFKGSFWGWGAGGADNIPYLCGIAKDLGFKKVVSILDGDKQDKFQSLQESFPEYHFEIIPADDIRTKSARDAVEEKQGLLNKKMILKEEFHNNVNSIIDNINCYLQS